MPCRVVCCRVPIYSSSSPCSPPPSRPPPAPRSPRPHAPVATTGAATAITQTGATLNGTVDRNDGATTYHFEYGTSPAYGLDHAGDAGPPRAAPTRSPSRRRSRASRATRPTTTASSPPTRPGISRGANRTFRTRPGPAAAGRHLDRLARRHLARRAADHDRRPQRAGDHGPLRVRPHDELRRVQRPRQRGRRRQPRAGLGRPRRPAAQHPLPLPRRRDELGRHDAQPRPLVRTPREPTGISITLTPSRVVWGGSLTVIGRVAGTARRRHAGGARAPGLPVQRGLQPGRRHAHRRPRRLVPLRRALAVRDHPVPRRHAHGQAASPARSAPRRARSRSGARAQLARPPQAPRIAGRDLAAGPDGRVSLQKRSPRGRWAVVRAPAAKPLDANRSRYRFTVRRGKRGAGTATASSCLRATAARTCPGAAAKCASGAARRKAFRMSRRA